MKEIPYTVEGYVTYMQYSATGEGMTYEIQFCWADSPQKAIEKHLTRFGYKDKKSRDYFRLGVVAYHRTSKETRDLFKRFFKDGEKMFNLMQDATFDLQYKVYWNLS